MNILEVFNNLLYFLNQRDFFALIFLIISNIHSQVKELNYKLHASYVVYRDENNLSGTKFAQIFADLVTLCVILFFLVTRNYI